MRLFVGSLVTLVALAVSPAPAAPAGGGHAEQPAREVVTEVREVDRIQNRLLLADGTEVWATDPRQLDQISDGTKVRIRIEMVGGKRIIYSVERLAK